MPNTYTQLYIQIVFAVQNRAALIHEPIREEIQKYLTGIVKNNQHKMLAVFCMPDHAHVFVGLNPNQSISSLAKDEYLDLLHEFDVDFNEQYLFEFFE